MTRRVAVTGIGALTPLGGSFSSSWDALRKGITGIGPITRFDTSGIKWKMAGELKGFTGERLLSPKERIRLDPFAQYAVCAAAEALGDAGFLFSGFPGEGPSLGRAGIIIGSSRGGVSSIEKALTSKRVSPYLMPSSTVGAASSYIAQRFGIKGHAFGISSACASGMQAVAEAFRLIKGGLEDVVLAGGADAPLTRLCVEGYGRAGALSACPEPGASRPFDLQRDGFVLSEGACVLILEEYGHALARGARIYGEVPGTGGSIDAFHETRPDPAGEAQAMSEALRDASLSPRDIGLVSAHATSTPIGDRAEEQALRIALGQKWADQVPVIAVKALTGHMLSASGPFEAGVSLMCMREEVVLPAWNLRQKDSALNLPGKTASARIEAALANSFGFGGFNASVVLRKA